MKNYYEILEVNKKASAEIIDKAHKTLVKKYHPDLQETSEDKIKNEAKIKEINEAYEILGNTEKRAEYDKTLAAEEKENQERLIQEQIEKEIQNLTKENNYNNINNQNDLNNNYYNNKNNINNNYSDENYNNENNLNNSNINNTNTQNNMYNEQIEQFQKDYEDTLNKAYHDAYIQDMKNRGYKIKYKKTWNERLRSLIALLITIGIIFLIFQIPFVKNYFYSLYKDNEIIRNIVDGLTGWFR